MDFIVPAEHRVKLKENKKRDVYQDLARELKTTMENDADGDTSRNWCTRNNPQKLGKGTRILGNKRTRRDHPNYSINKMGQHTEKSPGDLRRIAVTQTPVRKHQCENL